MSSQKNPCPGKLGVLEEGAYADLLWVDGSPLESIELIGDPKNSFILIMKDGMNYINNIMK